MKGHLFTIILLWSIGNISFAQAPDWKWARNATGTASFSVGIASDGSGNVYTTGYFSSPTVTFGSYTLTNGGDSVNIFVVKYDSTGNVIWAKSFGGTGIDESTGISMDGKGNIYIIGAYSSPTIVFGTDTFINYGPVGNSFAFIVKCDSSGTELWAKTAGGIGISGASSITADTIGYVYVTGSFSGPDIVFGNDTLSKSSIGDSSDLFILKYDSSGTLNWAERIGAAGSYVGSFCVREGATGDLYMTGSVIWVGIHQTDTIVFGNDTIANLGSQFMFVVKYNPTGTMQWVETFGNPYGGEGSGITTDVNGNVYITGAFDNDSLVFAGDTLIGSGSSNTFFVLKYDSLGAAIWARGTGRITGISTAGNGISIDTSGNIYITGVYFGSTVFGSDTLESYGGDIFLVKYDTSGTVLWAQGLGGNGYNNGTGIDINAKGDIYITGYFQDTIWFGSDVLTAPLGSSDVFVAKMGTTTTGVDHITPPTQHFTIYPNPTQNQATIEWQPTGEPTGYLTIYDLLCRQISDEQVDGASGRALLNTSALDNGLYVVKLYLGNGEVMSGKLAVGR